MHVENIFQNTLSYKKNVLVYRLPGLLITFYLLFKKIHTHFDFNNS